MRPGDMMQLGDREVVMHNYDDWFETGGSKMKSGDLCLLLEIGDYDGPRLGFEVRVLAPQGVGWIMSNYLNRVTNEAR